MVQNWDPRTRQRVLGALGAMLFCSAWGLMLAAAVFVDVEQEPMRLEPVLWLPGMGSTLMFVIIVCMDWDALYADELTHYRAREAKLGARALLATGCVLGVTSLIAALYILTVVYAGHRGVGGGNTPDSVFPGVCIFLQSFLLILGAVVTRVGMLDLSPHEGIGGGNEDDW